MDVQVAEEQGATCPAQAAPARLVARRGLQDGQQRVPNSPRRCAALSLPQARPLPLHTDRYELPPPANTGGQAALADDLAILQQQEAAQQAAGSSGAAPGSGRRRRRQRRSEDGTSGAAAADPGASFDEELASEGDISAREEDGEGSGSEGEEEGDSPSELVFRLERRGEGWGEEIFPHIVVEKRPMQLTKSKHKCQHPDPWEVRRGRGGGWGGASVCASGWMSAWGGGGGCCLQGPPLPGAPGWQDTNLLLQRRAV